jgi:hypothetical protein
MFVRAAATAAVFCAAMTPAAGFMTSPLAVGGPGARLAAARPARAAFAPMATRVKATAAASISVADYGDVSNVQLSGLKGKALIDKEFPTKKQVFDAMPANTWDRDDKLSLMYAAISTALTLGTGALAWMFLPLKMSFLPLWAAYWWAAGTIATGCWVIAHECGHGAFSDNKKLQDFVGYVLHTALLVPYFSWQRSHAVHHSKTNHVFEGETHVPYTLESGKKTLAKKAFFQKVLGEKAGAGFYAMQRMVSHLVFGFGPHPTHARPSARSSALLIACRGVGPLRAGGGCLGRCSQGWIGATSYVVRRASAFLRTLSGPSGFCAQGVRRRTGRCRSAEQRPMGAPLSVL